MVKLRGTKKPVTVDFYTLTTVFDEKEALSEWFASFGDDLYEKAFFTEEGLKIKTLEGTSYLATSEDVIIRGVVGEYYPCKKTIFTATYDVVIENFGPANEYAKSKHFQTSSFRVFPNDLNYGDSLFGGKICSEVDCEAAKVAWSVLYGTEANNVVTKTMKTDFLAPAFQGDMVVMEADVISTGKTSITIRVDLFKWNGPDKINWVKIGETTAVFVALKDGKKFEHGRTKY